MRKARPNLLIICGSGQNSGKTSLVKSIIRHYAIHHDIAAIKISSHPHEAGQQNLLWEEGHCKIFLEEEVSGKDSSQFMQAGANPALYIETSDDHLEAAFSFALAYIGIDKLIICESGMLGRLYKPGIMIFIENGRHKPLNESKSINRGLADLIVPISDDTDLGEMMEKVTRGIEIEEGCWKLFLNR